MSPLAITTTPTLPSAASIMPRGTLAFASMSSLDSNASRTVRVIVTADLLCPWCYVGLKKLQMAHGNDIEVAITFRPFLIQPHIPAAGVPTGGTPESRVSDDLREAAAAVGLSITGLCNRTPDAKLFHACIEHLQNVIKEGNSKAVADDESLDDSPSLTQADLVEFYENVCEGYHTMGIYPDEEGLLMMAMRCEKKDLILPSLRKLFGDNMQLMQLKDQVHEKAMESIREGILSVPHYKFDKKKTLLGAQPLETFALFEETFAK